MARDDWYRNTVWDDQIAAAFQDKLRRTRDKSEYLRIQAYHLRHSHPKAALALLDQFFALDRPYGPALAALCRAEALIALDDHDGALAAFEAAFAYEAQFPNTVTSAYLDYACFVAIAGLHPYYTRALDVLDAHPDRPAFPIEQFRAHGAAAILLDQLGQRDGARARARLAMRAAGQDQSGFRHHPTLGLVEGQDDPFSQRVIALAQCA